MFTKKITESDAFLDMPASAQALYFHLNMHADDDGFVNSPKSIQRTVGASNDDLKLLLAKKFILAFDSGVIVIKHWKMHNYIRSDRYKTTDYSDERAQLELSKSGIYSLTVNQMDTDGIPMVSIGKDRLGKDRLGQISLGKVNNNIVTSNNICPTSSDVSYPYKEVIEYLNQMTGRKYSATSKANQTLIRARCNEDRTLDDFKLVIDIKCEEWLGTDQEKYLRPETLFKASHFESYLNQGFRKDEVDNWDI